MSKQQNNAQSNPPDPFVGGNFPTPAPAAPAPYIPPPPGNPIHTGGGITRVNSTGDSRVIWEDGTIAIIYAKDFPAGTGMGRSPTRKTIQDALNATIDQARQTNAGPGVANDFCKVYLKELLARGAAPKKQLSPSGFYRPEPKPMVAQGYGSVPKGTVIPDAHFPHVCGMCGGWYYQGTREHNTPDGKCPTQTPKPGMKARR